MGQPSTLPLKKKKKRSFFEDDDFFVLKKNRKTKSPALKPTLPKKPTENVNGVSSGASSDNILSDDLVQSFHSARDTFSGDEGVEVPDLEALKGPNSQIQKDTEILQDVEHLKESKEEHEKDSQKNHIQVVDDVEDDPDSALSTFFKGISSQKEDLSRIYLVRVISKVFECEDEVEVSGDFNFDSIMREVLLRRGYNMQLPENCLLMWVEGRSELKPFFKPSTLRIPPSAYGAPSRVTVLHIAKFQLGDLERFYDQYGNKDSGTTVHFEVMDNSVDIEDVVDDLVVLVDEITSPKDSPSPQHSSEYFVIGLKGKDNKRIECEVGPQTKIRDLLAHYLKVKGLEKVDVGKAKLIFDDEPLDLDGKVGDTELEEDFEVQIYI
ncbi:CIC11C00000004740 [Sungouiella intermedia]|uniref:CIC11C00000004740 n=1 Tax=Sungouiella intermedia TaxID=45354 RepID=A0A1L0CSX1_9ASCO|nr:CIC11C00000004740 [[Candida] intermedia]